MPSQVEQLVVRVLNEVPKNIIGSSRCIAKGSEHFVNYPRALENGRSRTGVHQCVHQQFRYAVCSPQIVESCH